MPDAVARDTGIGRAGSCPGETSRVMLCGVVQNRNPHREERGSVGNVRMSWQEGCTLGAQPEEAMDQIQAASRGS